MTKKQIWSAVISILIAALTAAAAAFGLSSCSVTRVVTTTSQYVQKGDTTVTIQTRTVESYDATKKVSF